VILKRIKKNYILDYLDNGIKFRHSAHRTRGWLTVDKFKFVNLPLSFYLEKKCLKTAKMFSTSGV